MHRIMNYSWATFKKQLVDSELSLKDSLFSVRSCLRPGSPSLIIAASERFLQEQEVTTAPKALQQSDTPRKQRQTKRLKETPHLSWVCILVAGSLAGGTRSLASALHHRLPSQSFDASSFPVSLSVSARHVDYAHQLPFSIRRNKTKRDDGKTSKQRAAALVPTEGS